MSLTTNDDPKSEITSDSERANPDPSSGSADPIRQSGYDVVASAASPTAGGHPERWDQFVLFNVAIPIALILTGAVIIRVLGKAEAQPLPPPDTSATAVLESLPAALVEPIRTLEQTGEDLELAIDGTVVPYSEAIVSSEVSGRVIYKSPDCEAGAIVEAGTELMRIDPKDYELEVERLTRLREQEYSALGEVDQEVINTNRSIEIAKKDVLLKEKEVKRQAELKAFASQAEVDQAQSALLQAQQQRVNLTNQLDLLRSRRSRLMASEQLAASQLSLAELNLERCTVKAPIGGVIVSEQADLNTFVSRGTPLVTIEDTSKVEVAASMRMDQLHWVLDQTASPDDSGYEVPKTPAIIEYEVAGRTGTVHRWNGTLISYDGIGIDPATRTVPVRILVDDPTHFRDEDGKLVTADRTNALMRGMFVRVRLKLKPRSKLIVIPGKALRPGNRVWKFTADEAVLQQRIAEAMEEAEEAAKKSDASTAVESAPKKSESEKPPFDPTKWKAGLVRYSTTVFPIDSLRLSRDQENDPSLSPSLQSPERLWVCEASKSDLAGGDYVVVSQLDSIPPDGLQARANTEQ